MVSCHWLGTFFASLATHGLNKIKFWDVGKTKSYACAAREGIRGRRPRGDKVTRGHGDKGSNIEGTSWKGDMVTRGTPLRGQVGKWASSQGVVLGRDAVAPLLIV